MNRRKFLRDTSLGVAGICTPNIVLAGSETLDKKTIDDVVSSSKKKSSHTHIDLDHSTHSSHGPTVFDHFGTLNFAHGIYTLATKQDLGPSHYPGQIGLIAGKYVCSDDEGKNHIKKEIVEGLIASTAILGLTSLFEGVGLNLDKLTNYHYGRDCNLEEKLFTLSALPPITSSLTTTIGSATVLRDDVKDIVSRICTDVRDIRLENHVEDLDKDHYITLRKDLLSIFQAHVCNTSGFNFAGDPPFIAVALKYGADGLAYQNKTLWPLTAASSYRVLHKLHSRISKEIPDKIRKPQSIISDKKHIQMWSYLLGNSFTNASKKGLDVLGKSVEQDNKGIIFEPFTSAMEKIRGTGIFLSEYSKHVADCFSYGQIRMLADAFSPAHIKERLHHKVGPNIADVACVFPFQAMSIPLLQPEFEYAMHKLDYLPSEVKDATAYLAFSLFSGVADNYVACKIGLELYPDRPEIPLTASIIGGSLLPLGNMANLALCELKDLGLQDGLKRIHKNADMLGLGYGYARAIPLLREIPMLGKLYDNSNLKVASNLSYDQFLDTMRKC